MSLILTGNSSSLTVDSTNGITFPNSTNQTSASKVLQVVQASNSTTTTTTSTSYVNTGLSASITPLFSTSKILVIVSQPMRIYNTTSSYLVGQWRLLRGATAVLTIPAVLEIAATNAVSGYQISGSVPSFTYLDSPANASSQTYSTQMCIYSATSGTIEAQNSSGTATITLMEIAA